MEAGERLVALKDNEDRFIEKGRKYKIIKLKDNYIDLRSLNGLIHTGISENDFDEYFEKLPSGCKFRKNDIVIDEETKDILLIIHKDKTSTEDVYSTLKIDITMKEYRHYTTNHIGRNYVKLTYENFEESKRKCK